MSVFRRLSPVFVGILLFSITVFCAGSASQWIVQTFFYKPNTFETIAAAQRPEIFQGAVIQELALKRNDNFPLYGSSEFSSWSEFHPSSFFSGAPTGFYPFLIGRGGNQDLIHAMNIASQYPEIKGKRVGVVLSAQWFTTQGLPRDYFNGNFSPLHSYRSLFNSSLSPETKKKLSERLLDYEDSLVNYPILVKLLKTYGKEDGHSRLKYYLNYPLARMELSALELKDSIKSALYLREVNQKVSKKAITPPVPRQLESWEQYFDRATQQGKASVTNNPYGVIDSYYTTYLEKDIATLKNSYTGFKTYPSPEYNDLTLLLDVLKEQEMEALFFIIPVNGYWYDYINFSQEERAGYYNRVKELIAQKGFAVADFSSMEYEPYFLKDIMHIGWKGWVYVDQELVEFNKE